MNFLAILLRGISFIPAVVHGVEALFGSKSGADKKDAALLSAEQSRAEIFVALANARRAATIRRITEGLVTSDYLRPELPLASGDRFYSVFP